MLNLNIQGSKISIPQKWDELTRPQYLYVVDQLLLHFIGKVDKVELRLRVLMYITSYREVRKGTKNKIIFISKIFRFKLRRKLNLLSAEKYGKIVAALQDQYLVEDRGLIDYNLIKLSECLDFLMEETLIPDFTYNPLKEIKGIGKGRFFNVDLINITDITAGNFADAIDIVSAYSYTKEEILLDWLIAITYGEKQYKFSEIKQSQLHRISKLPFAIKYGVYLWYISISQYLSKHPVYSLLYAKQIQNNDEKINLGIHEAILKLAQSGYGPGSEIKEYDLIRFMDLQISDVKRNLREAISAGVEISKIAEKTGYSISQINMLI